MAYSWNNTFALSKVPVGTSGKCPCKGCTDRNARCHSGCKKYAAWSDEMNKAKDVASKVARADKDVKGFLFGRNMDKNIKYKLKNVYRRCIR